MTRCAAIDIGSNTTRLLVAEPVDGQLKKTMEQRAYTRIGKAIDENGILLENGRRLSLDKPLHIRQGYTITSQTSQGHERAKMFGLLTVSATSQINAVQMLVSLSRASREARLYTDSFDVLREVAVRPGVGRSALELVEGVAHEREAAPNLQQDVSRTEGHSEVSPVRPLSLSEYEKSLRERAAQRYPDADPELAQKIERTIQRRLQEYRAQEVARSAQEHARHEDLAEERKRQQGRSLEHGIGM